MSNLNKESFQSNPVRLDVSRSKITGLSHRHVTTFSAGRVIPIWAYSDVLPGDTFKVGLSFAIRSTTPVAPVMDDLFADVFFFFVPHKLVLSRRTMSPSVNDPAYSWESFIGAQDSLLNMPTPSDSRMPVVVHGVGGSLTPGSSYFSSLANYLCMPPANDQAGTVYYSALEPLAYYSVWNDYFRDPNTMNPVTYVISASNGENVVYFNGGTNSGNFYIGDSNSILTASPFHGYFGSALPWPQRNSTSVLIPLGDSAPVITGLDNSSALAFRDILNQKQMVSGNLDVSVGNLMGSGYFGTDSGSQYLAVQPRNLYADLSSAAAASVNALRLAVQSQRWYEQLARGGNRIDEMTMSMFGVTPKDAGANRAEFLGAKRIRLDVEQVVNSAGASSASSVQEGLGTTGAYSLTNNSDHYFTKSFDTWGTILAVIVVRPNETFHQGRLRRHKRRERFDLYWPSFANLGEMSIEQGELYVTTSESDNEKVFGYQEAWAEYRFEENQLSGEFRNSLKYWTYANDFASAPTLPGYLNAKDRITQNVDQTLMVSNSAAGFQFIGDFYFDVTAVRPMPLYSVPGLVDHH